MVELGMALNTDPSRGLTNIRTEERSEDMCPICKTDRYLSPDMQFLVNAECYHKMCESCVDRIFATGPAPCPYPGCGKTLRKNKFKIQIFDDISVEREVDVRKRVQNIFNKTLDNFDGDLDRFNSYLEEVEDTIFNLVNSVDVEDTERKIEQYKASHNNKILENNALRDKEFEDFKKQEEFEKDLKLKKQLLEQQIEEEDRRFKESARKEILNKLASGSDAKQTLTQYKKSQLKRSSASKRRLEEINASLDNSRFSKNSKELQSNIPFTPFNGDRCITKHFKINKSYYDPFIDELKLKKDYIAAGFKPENVYERVISEAFIGLGCIIEKEKAQLTAQIV